MREHVEETERKSERGAAGERMLVCTFEDITRCFNTAGFPSSAPPGVHRRSSYSRIEFSYRCSHHTWTPLLLSLAQVRQICDPIKPFILDASLPSLRRDLLLASQPPVSKKSSRLYAPQRSNTSRQVWGTYVRSIPGTEDQAFPTWKFAPGSLGKLEYFEEFFQASQLEASRLENFVSGQWSTKPRRSY